MDDVGVMAEVHPGRIHRPHPPEQGLPGRPVGGLAWRQRLAGRALVLARCGLVRTCTLSDKYDNEVKDEPETHLRQATLARA